ncbi:hypothetical protein AAHA92_14640 [Salvia divinorum]|uniref:Uncharacterized protein n=1 Tax=Salvia divinorum TaxID=28513 RepID=A0ABD1HC91_SALDI
MAANFAIIMVTILALHHQTTAATNVVKIEVFRSPEIVMEPGLVSSKDYFNIDFPRGNIGLKGFNAELVDERGNPVPLHEIYLHHWVLNRYFARKNTSVDGYDDLSIVRNSGICGNGLLQYFGVGAETRRTSTHIPHPYAIQVGDLATIPPGYEEGWVLNVHAIDTRGADDKMGCTECRCDLYGFSKAGGGLRCCPDDSRCRLKQGFRGKTKTIYLRYTVKYVEWDSSSIIPVDIYILDVTDVWTKVDQSKGIRPAHHCKVEYGVESCAAGVEKDGCVDTKSAPHYKVREEEPYAHLSQYMGKERKLETRMVLFVESHTGVMAFFYLLLAHTDQKPLPTLESKFMMVSEFIWPIVLFGVVVIAAVVALKGIIGNSEGYEAIQ